MIDPKPVNIRAMAPTSRRIALSLDMHNSPCRRLKRRGRQKLPYRPISYYSGAIAARPKDGHSHEGGESRVRRAGTKVRLQPRFQLQLHIRVRIDLVRFAGWHDECGSGA